MSTAREMHLIRKKVVTAGKHKAVRNGSTREDEVIDRNRLAHWDASIKEMMADGLKLPCPWAHFDENKNPPAPVVFGKSGELIDPQDGQRIHWRADLNGGFIHSSELLDDGLYLTVEAPGDPEDLNTPAGKMGTTVQEVSLGIAEKYVAGNGKEYHDVPIHLCCGVHAVEASQENFIPLSKGKFSMFGMSTLADGSSENPDTNTVETPQGGEVTTTDPKEAINLLREFSIDLPDDTTQDNIIERLVIVCKQKKADKEAEEEEGLVKKPPQPAKPMEPPKDSKEKEGIITMSTESLLEKTALRTMANLTRDGYSTRAKALVGKVPGFTKELCDKFFGKGEGQPLNVFTMTTADLNEETGEPKATQYDFALNVLEALQSTGKVDPSLEDGLTLMNTEITNGYQPDGTIERHLQDASDDLKPEEIAPFRSAVLGRR